MVDEHSRLPLVSDDDDELELGGPIHGGQAAASRHISGAVAVALFSVLALAATAAVRRAGSPADPAALADEVGMYATLDAAGCDCSWIPQDSCEQQTSCALTCRAANPWGPCTSQGGAAGQRARSTSGPPPAPVAPVAMPSVAPANVKAAAAAAAAAAAQSEAPKVQSEAPKVQSEAPKVQSEALKVLDTDAAATSAGETGPYACGVALNDTDQTENLHREYSQWKETYILNVGADKCVVRPTQVRDISANPSYPADCVSEGIGYGMLIAAYLGDRGTFDGLWSFSQKYLNVNGLMGWQIWPNHPNPVVGNGAATDADEDMAMALLVAAERWGGNYGALARQQVEKVFEKEIDHTTYAVRPGDMWGSCQQIDPSYFSPAWYKVFGAATGRQAEWDKVNDAGFQLLGKCNARNGGTGLTPQWTDCECAVSPAVGKYPDKYWCDAVRVPLRMAISAAWHCDARAQQQTELLAAFFSKELKGKTMNKGFTITGQPIQTPETDNACTENCFVVTGAAALVTGSKDARSRAAFWRATSEKPEPGQECYFCDTLRLLSLLFTTGVMKPPRV